MVKTIDANQWGKIRVILFTALLGTGMLVCGICDLAIASRLTWSLIVWSSILAAWGVGIFVVRSGKKGIRTALIAFSIVLAPFLYVLSCLIKVREVFRMGAVLAVLGLLFLWGAYFLFARLPERKKLAAGGVCLSAILLVLLVNLVVSGWVGGPAIDGWDLLGMGLLLAGATAFFLADCAKKKKKS